MTHIYTPADAILDAERPPQPPAFHGLTVKAFAQVQASTDIVVLIDRWPHRSTEQPTFDRYVTGRANSLTDAEWSNGQYFTDYQAALLSMIVRAGVVM